MFWKSMILSALIAVMAPLASAASITYTGNFSQDEDSATIAISLPSSTFVTIRSTSFADGTTGFEPILTLFDSNGDLFLQDATGGTTPGGCSGRSIDPVSHFCLDGLIQTTLNGGNYTLLITEYDNFPGNSLTDPLAQAGNGNFTGPEFLPGGGTGSFILFDGSQRNNNWSVTIDGLAVPEPGSATLVLSSIVALGLVSRRVRGR